MNITPYFNKLEYINLTAQQIIKDFDLFGIEITFSGSGDNAYNELLYQVSPHISTLMESNYKKLLDLLYRIDVNEAKISDIINDKAVSNPAEAIADLVIKRELQKIVIRRNFSVKDQ